MVKECLSKELLTKGGVSGIDQCDIYLYFCFLKKRNEIIIFPFSIWTGNSGEPLSACQMNIHSGEWQLDEKGHELALQGELQEMSSYCSAVSNSTM